MNSTPHGEDPQVNALIQFVANLTAPIIARHARATSGILTDKDGRQYEVSVTEIIPPSFTSFTEMNIRARRAEGGS